MPAKVTPNKTLNKILLKVKYIIKSSQAQISFCSGAVSHSCCKGEVHSQKKKKFCEKKSPLQMDSQLAALEYRWANAFYKPRKHSRSEIKFYRLTNIGGPSAPSVKVRWTQTCRNGFEHHGATRNKQITSRTYLRHTLWMPTMQLKCWDGSP